jgi:hypothetical protein
MSNSTEQKHQATTGRIQVGSLPEQEKELEAEEAEKVQGGGGLSSGVIATHIGEEIPQRN